MSDSEEHSSDSEASRQELDTSQAQDVVHSSHSTQSCLNTQSEGTTKAEDDTTTTTAESNSRRMEQDPDPDSDTLMNQDSKTTSNQGTSSSAAEPHIPPSEREHEPKLTLTAKKTKEVEEKECEIMYELKETVRSLKDKFDSSPVEVTSSSSQTSEMPSSPEAPTRIRGQEEANRRDTISLANIPTTTVERGLYFNYKLLLLRITRMLLSGDVIKLKEWATSILSVDVTANVDDVFVELDRRGVISDVNLEKLREFFEEILRFDLVHMIDCFITGDYSYLRNTSEGTPRLNNQGITPRVNDPSQRATASSGTSLQSSVLTSGKHSLHSQARTSEVEESYVPPQSRRPDTSAVTPSNCRTEVSGGTTHQPFRGQLVTNAPGSKNATSNGSTGNRARSQVDMGSNGRNLSQFQRADSARNNNSKTQAPNDDSDSDDDDDDSECLCSHYKRRCSVNFDCCDKCWPCHRCHNNESKCGQKLKSRDTKFLKCVSCEREKQFYKHVRTPDAAKNGDSRNERDSGVLQRKYRCVPGGPQLSPSYPVQTNGDTSTTTAESSMHNGITTYAIQETNLEDQSELEEDSNNNQQPRVQSIDSAQQGYYGDIPEALDGVDIGFISFYITDSLGGKY